MKYNKSAKQYSFRICIAAIILCMFSLLFFSSCNSEKAEAYNEAVKAYEAENYMEAKAAFEALEGYKDSDKKIEEIKEKEYEKACECFNEKLYTDALPLFFDVKEYKDAAEKCDECEELVYQELMQLMSDGKYEKASHITYVTKECSPRIAEVAKLITNMPNVGGYYYLISSDEPKPFGNFSTILTVTLSFDGTKFDGINILPGDTSIGQPEKRIIHLTGQDNKYELKNDKDHYIAVISNDTLTLTYNREMFAEKKDRTAVFSSDSTSSNSNSGFTNKFGTPTTKCAHSGCNNFIASSGDTNCCEEHSNKCADCGKYIDEDAMYCMDCLKKAKDANE